ncbi:MAG TPA: 3-hydroxyacyl-CoA dehydrogenase/enoyl-CoA hydratase family protein [Xanthomonadaceae bacterium]|nr:3-hydroxyacyl-CoA dehydrogenase/enoyl-CoA hydratase family protein [Xanthomonadaceae bacterium]
MSELPMIRKAAVLGAGVMGAQIAAHLTNAGIDTVLFDLPSGEGGGNGIVDKALANLVRLSPAPLARKDLAAAITPANYAEHLELLGDCDLVIEAIAERMDWKHDLYGRIAPHLADDAIVASNTSGLSIESLAASLPEALRRRFCGVHFFNPPRYMQLVELIPTRATDPALLDALESFLTTVLGKGVVRALDTPNFIGNRIGVFSMLAAMHHTQAQGLGFDTVDALTGPAIGRPKSATYRTADVVGLDTMAHVIRTMAETLPEDPWHAHFAAPAWLRGLVDQGALGQKAGAGIYRKRGKTIEVLDRGTGDYREAAGEVAPEVGAILALKDPGEKFAALRASQHPQARFLWAIFRDLWHYSAVHLASIARTTRDIDLALRWGYGWKQGPFETWQVAGWKRIAEAIAADIVDGSAMSSEPLPDWVFDGRDGVYGTDGAFSPAQGEPIGRSQLPVYARQRFPDPVLGERFDAGQTVFETDAVRMWHDGDGIAVLGFRTKMNTVSDGVLDGILQAVEVAERDFDGLVLWQSREPFSAGADLAGAMQSLQSGKLDRLEQMVATFQRSSQRIKYSLVPVVAAVRGMALGGGCEFQMHAACTVAALESYIGLVEAGVGLLPAGGGLKEIATRVGLATGAGGDLIGALRPYFEAVAMAKVSSSAFEARELGLLRPHDPVVFNPYELLHVARTRARAMAGSGYRPPLPARQIPVAGATGIATFRMMLVNMLEGGFISEHDNEIATRIATVMCGGELERGSVVDEDWLLALEREHFVALAQMPRTQERVVHTLKTGKPLRN